MLRLGPLNSFRWSNWRVGLVYLDASQLPKWEVARKVPDAHKRPNSHRRGFPPFSSLLRLDSFVGSTECRRLFTSRLARNTYDEIEAAKEEKDEKLNEVEIDLISDTEEQDTIINDEIGLDEAGEAGKAGEP